MSEASFCPFNYIETNSSFDNAILENIRNKEENNEKEVLVL